MNTATAFDNKFFSFDINGEWVNEEPERGYSYRSDDQSKHLAILHGVNKKAITPEEKIKLSTDYGMLKLEHFKDELKKPLDKEKLIMEAVDRNVVFKYRECNEEMGVSIALLICVYDHTLISLMLTDNISIDSDNCLSILDTVFDNFKLKAH